MTAARILVERPYQPADWMFSAEAVPNPTSNGPVWFSLWCGPVSAGLHLDIAQARGIAHLLLDAAAAAEQQGTP